MQLNTKSGYADKSPCFTGSSLGKSLLKLNGENPMKPNAQTAIARAKQEIVEEEQQKAVMVLKVKYRELSAAQAVVANVEREIADLELSIEHGNV